MRFAFHSDDVTIIPGFLSLQSVFIRAEVDVSDFEIFIGGKAGVHVSGQTIVIQGELGISPLELDGALYMLPVGTRSLLRLALHHSFGLVRVALFCSLASATRESPSIAALASFRSCMCMGAWWVSPSCDAGSASTARRSTIWPSPSA